MEAVLQKINILVEWMNRFSMGGTRMIEIKSNAETAQELAASLKSSGDALWELHRLRKMNKPNYLVMMRPIKPLILLKPKQKKLQRRLNQSGPTCKAFATGFTAVDEATAASIQ